MLLTKENLPKIASVDASTITDNILQLPEKVLLFGTGVLLRGLPNYFIDKANKKGIFNGRVVMVKSTQQGDSSELTEQDFLYTLCIRGISQGEKVSENIINTSVSRILNAGTEWQQVLACAGNKNLSVIISNTTEVGIRYVAESIEQTPPQSFPAKLLSFLYERYKVCNGDENGGCIIIPTELINENGNVLKSVLTELARFNQLSEDFISWLLRHNRFCNSLVDRIVPGKMNAASRQAFEQEAGYEDQAAIMAEPYALWAIEGDEKVREALSFSKEDKRVIITDNIEKYRELKLRLLNGTHTFSCALAFLKGFATVKEVMQNEEMKKFITRLMYEEIIPAIHHPISQADKEQFAADVLDRFSNPYIEHRWLSISLNYTDKMKTRNVPLIVQYCKEHQQPPSHMALGFAAFLRFMQPVKKEGDAWYGLHNGITYTINDPAAAYFYQAWQQAETEDVLMKIMSNRELWGIDLAQTNGFSAAVLEQYFLLKAI